MELKLRVKRNKNASEFIKKVKEYKEADFSKLRDEDLKEFITGKGISGIGRSFFNTESQPAIFKYLRDTDLVRQIKKLDSRIENRKIIYEEFEKGILKGNRNNVQAVHAMITALQPDFLCNIVSEDRLDELHNLLLEEKAKLAADNNLVVPQGTEGNDSDNGIIEIILREWDKLEEDWGNKNWYEKSANMYEFFDANKFGYNPNSNDSNSDIPWPVLMALNGDERIDKFANRLNLQKNIILTGAPGTGKTYMAREIAKQLITIREKKKPSNDDLKKQIDFVQFHPSYDYSDFVEGLRPAMNGTSVTFERMDGQFKAFCGLAANETKKTFVFIIDEINRGEISKIFGELFFAIDPGYRDGGKEEHKTYVKTQYHQIITEGMDKQSKNQDYKFKMGFYVPSNVYIIGTMNDIDRSVDSMDIAFRRRFAFFDISAYDSEAIIYNSKELPFSNDKYSIPGLIDRMERLNEAIIDPNRGGLTPEYQIGGAYFLRIKDVNYSYDRLWNEYLEGVVKEYYRGQPDQAKIVKKLKVAYYNDLNEEGK